MAKDYRTTPNYQKGLDVFTAKYEKSHLELIDQLYSFSPELADEVFAHGLYEIWVEKTPSLSIPQKEIAVLSSLITDCTVPSEIKAHTQNLLNVGISKQQIIELLILLTLYIGVPKVIQAMKLVQEAFKEYEAVHGKIG